MLEYAVNRRQTTFYRQFRHPFSLGDEHGILQYNKRSGPLLGRRGKNRI